MSEGIGVSRVSAARYGEMAAAFADLCLRAEAPNLHMAPAAIAAALSGPVKQADDIVILCADDGNGVLLGVWAFRRIRTPQTGFSAMLQAPLVPLYEVASAPVLDREAAAPAALALLRFIAEAADLPKRLRLPLLPVEGATFEALAAGCAETRSALHRFEAWDRPMAIPMPGDTAEAYLRRALGQGYKKRLQQHRMLERAGQLRLTRHRRDEAATALDNFFALEAAGWKGSNGTALAKLPADAAYFREVIGRFAAADMARIDLLRLDNVPIAAGVLLDFAGQSHFLKIAYDEALARLSPGRGLAIEMLRADFTTSQPFRLDSGAGDRVDASAYPWGERQAMAHAIIAIGSAGSPLPRLAARGRMLLRQWRDRKLGSAGGAAR
ncbi:GNAT family N-acetyltransferase [Bosea rubneri]|uniref:GNAT family N-acetyltransferase n=1 Tax=Bosea rubneri TaxID=3075434 RepID=A0ABU3S508_9HYPH|nr:GNAT family N-acetyltransferase [Bosea sp. ZW T0_25]MDU0339863.1 GNAT family N-acetyltransferase [Bosea sp. ZW T0_25]